MKEALRMTNLWDVLAFAAICMALMRLTGVVDWSWLWVTAPLWLPVAFMAGVFALICVVGWGMEYWGNRQ